LFKAAGFEVQPHLGLESSHFPDLIVGHEIVGRYRRYAIEIALVHEDVELLPRIDRLEQVLKRGRGPDKLDEAWLVSNLAVPERKKGRYHGTDVRAFTLTELERMLSRLIPPAQSRSKQRTEIGKAVFANGKQLHIAIAALTLLLDEKIAALNGYIPNDPDSITQRDASLQQYLELKQKLAAIIVSIKKANEGTAKEAEVVKTVTTFADGVRAWWNKSHETICTKAYDMGLFASAVGICSLAGAGGKIAVAVSAALVGGKPVADTIKGLVKKFGP
jgi:hypothetical protein